MSFKFILFEILALSSGFSLNCAFPTSTIASVTTTIVSDEGSTTTTTFRPLLRSQALTSVAYCPMLSLRKECTCQDANARVYVVCSALQLSDLVDLNLDNIGEGAAVWLLISNSPFSTLGPRAITTSNVDGLQINSSNVSQVHDNAFVDVGHLKSLAMQDNLLFEIPVEALKRLPALEMLSLAGNRIEQVPKNAFIKMKNLYYISLSQNRIENIDSECFGSNVKQLALSSNRLTSLNNSVQYLSKLEWLLLTDNQLTSLNNQLDNLQSLTTLHVGLNNLSDLGDSFRHLQRLKTLNLSLNNVEKIEENVFENVISLTTLDLSQNVITQVTPNAFRNLRKLAILDLHGNRLSSAEEFLEPISRTLMRLFLNDNRLTKFDLVMSGVRHLDLSDNGLRSIFESIHQAHIGGVGAGKHFLRLERLTLSGNQLERLPETLRLLTPALVDLELDGNRFTSFEEALGGEIGTWKRLKSLNLSGNALEKLSSRAFNGLVTVSELDLSRNRVNRIEPGCFSHLQGLENLDLSHNRLEYLDLGLFHGLHALQELTLANNLLRGGHQSTFELLTNLNHLDLSNNQLATLRYFLTPLKHLHTLNVSYNRLTEVDGPDVAELKELKTFHAAHNQISSLGTTQQLNLPLLAVLKLDHNQLLSLNSLTLEQLPNLYNLDVSANFLSHLHQDTFTRNRRLHKLHIQGNPWVCDNNFIETLLSLEADGIKFEEKNWCINSVVPADGTNLV